MARTSIIGGESRHRSRLGGSIPTWRLAAIGIAFAIGMFLTLILAEVGIVIGVLLIGGTWLLTATTSRGSILERLVARERWKERTERGLLRFQPFDQDEWDALAAKSRAKSKRVREDARMQAAAMRDLPDGASGMGWLQRQPRQPGIAWHDVLGEEPYLSVAFEVSGQLRGLESDRASEAAAIAWGRFLAGLSRSESVAKAVQVLTRVLPPDSARHQAWLLRTLDPNVPPAIARSYDQLVRKADDSAMIQRHFVVVRWPITTAFRRAARRFGEGQDGWRAFMRREIASMSAALRGAGHHEVDALSAARLTAVITHMQNPDHPIDRVVGIDPDRLGLPTLPDEWSAHVVNVTDPDTGEERQWWHRTGRIRAEDMATVRRDSMWLSSLLSGTGDGTLRTLSFQLWAVPAHVARSQTRLDRTRDRADQIARSKSGKIEDEEAQLRLTSSERRAADLAPGSRQAGIEWVGYLTVSARSREELGEACRRAQELAEKDMGVERLEWQDTYQAAASGCTWPIARGIQPPSLMGRDRLLGAMTGHGAKESL